jgi:capsular exopolysaccharide synthesis family protein
MQSSNGDRTGLPALPADAQLTGAISGLVGSEAENRMASATSSLSMAGLLKGLRRRWLLAASLGLTCGAISAAAAWYFLPPGKSTAQVSLRVNSVPKFEIFHDHQARAAFQVYQKTQIGLVKTRLVLTAALRNEDVARLSKIRELDQRGGDTGALEWLERELQVDFSLGPEFLRIAMTGDRPQELRIIVDAVKDAYLEKIPEKDREGLNKRLGRIEELYAEWENTVKTKREKISSKSKELFTTDPGAIAVIRRLDEEYLKLTEMQLLEVRSDLRKLKVRNFVSTEIKNPSDVNPPDGAVDEYLRNDPVGRALLARKQKIEDDIRRNEAVLAKGDPKGILKNYQSDLNAANEEIKSFRNKLQGQLKQDATQKHIAEETAGKANYQQRLAELQKSEDELDREVKKLQRNIEDKGQNAWEIEASKDDLQLAQEIVKKLANLREAITVELKAPSDVTEMEKAYITHPDEAKRKLVAASSSGLGALGLVLFVISWLEFRRQRINSVDEVVHGLGLKLMGTVPAFPSRRQLRLTGGNGSPDLRWQNILTESVDTARTMLLHMARSESIRVVMVTSATGGEGKTSLSSHLAASLARAGRKTLLLDADLRNPAIHRLFSIERSPGLCEILRGEATLRDTIRPTPAPGLSFVPAGRCDNLALQALAQDSLKPIYDQTRAEFDFVIVDSAPVLPVADSLLVAQSADAVIFSILHDVSRLPKVYAAHKRLEMLGIRMLGAVVSGTHVDSYGPDYQYTGQIEATVNEES